MQYINRLKPAKRIERQRAGNAQSPASFSHKNTLNIINYRLLKSMQTGQNQVQVQSTRIFQHMNGLSLRTQYPQ